MKKLALFLLIFLAFYAKSNAQTEKGRWIVGTQIGDFSYRKGSRESRFFSVDVAPSAGYFVSRNLVLGLSMPITTSSAKSTNYLNRQQEWGVAPFSQLYFGNGKLKPYLSITYKYSKALTLYHLDNQNVIKTNERKKAWSPGIGLAYFIANNLSLNAAINYNFYNNVIDNTSRYSDENATMKLGFNLFFGKTHE
ncbi:outer membrane beta-barrel protein [Siphonobacter sp. SORGH_AS_1065]|uniref:outer membrane beta-barrel protein n=1 Tax=Siphonobacter sp. SORGH_AS_1065 TaxID=3041795 RepID=UPI002782A19B|nr:outer membrane beta-barrel protein [Siphonobacter sp. SORGH_AS_1065]MDQ1088818.1 outer membrane protein W [Siphonobacter sp. SORGH_AS_1065]